MEPDHIGSRSPSIAVNVSAVEFAGAHFLDDVFEALNGTGLDPRALELELTESVLMKHAESTNSILQALNAGGVQMSYQSTISAPVIRASTICGSSPSKRSRSTSPSSARSPSPATMRAS